MTRACRQMIASSLLGIILADFRFKFRGSYTGCRYDPRNLNRKAAQKNPKSDRRIVLTACPNSCYTKAVYRFLIFLLPFSFLSAMEIGNPAQPSLQKIGVIVGKPSKWSLRLAYFDDYVYRMRFEDEPLDAD